jgi:hypothetical protein
MHDLLQELKQSISETQHTVIRINKEDYEKVASALFIHIWLKHTFEPRIIVCEENEIQDIVKQCIKPTTFIIIKDI